jgi:NhaP-type Na+/H+ and K+/H+ antiporter
MTKEKFFYKLGNIIGEIIGDLLSFRMTVGIIIGMSAGLMLGLAIDDISLGACLGMVFSAGLDVLDWALSRRNKKDK